MLESTLQVFIINLPRRSDRYTECHTEIQKCGIPPALVKFIEAKEDNVTPLSGCALSHAFSLAHFLYYSDRPFVLILEDDFHVELPDTFIEDLSLILRTASEWDVALLAHNQAVPIAVTSSKMLFRVVNAQTASAYIVRRDFIPRLIQLFFSSGIQLKKIENLIEPNKSVAKHGFAPDIWWKHLQNEFRFVGAFPRLVIQRASYSDIERTIVDYKV